MQGPPGKCPLASRKLYVEPAVSIPLKVAGLIAVMVLLSLVGEQVLQSMGYDSKVSKFRLSGLFFSQYKWTRTVKDCRQLRQCLEAMSES